MKVFAKNLLWLGLAVIVAWLWWAKEFQTTGKKQPVDPVRLSLEEATLFQYDSTGKQAERVHSKVIERLKNGETHYFSLQLWQKIPTGERIVTAGEGHRKGELLFLSQQVKAEQFEQQKPVITLQTDHLTYDHGKNIIETDGEVSLATPDSQTLVDGVKWQIKEKLFILKKNIRSVYEFTPQ